MQEEVGLEGGWSLTFYIGGGWQSTLPRIMSLIVWNYHGLGNLRIGKELRDIIRIRVPSVMFLEKTLIEEARLNRVLWEIDFDKKKKKGWLERWFLKGTQKL